MHRSIALRTRKRTGNSRGIVGGSWSRCGMYHRIASVVERENTFLSMSDYSEGELGVSWRAYYK